MEGRLTYSVPEAAAKLGIARSTAWRYIKSGLIPAFKFGGRTFVRAEDLKAVIDDASGRPTERKHDG